MQTVEENENYSLDLTNSYNLQNNGTNNKKDNENYSIINSI